ncbi:HCP-like protein [Gigaspora margarita]|uniref:HCP-like protein n=3 Tax=Gigaspora margarita TaxID=4874 RepID=A0A8H3XE45_GIGMA|nr:HCP-like protein [Gigaspora margarita]
MENQYDVSSVYSIFPSVNTSSIQSITNSDTIISTNPCTGSYMLPSPKYGVKQPNAYIQFQNTQQPLLIPQPDVVASLYYPTNLVASAQPISSSVNISKQLSSSIYPLNGFKVECSDILNDSMAVTQEDAIESKIHFVSTTNPFESGYPPTPTTPRNEILLPMTPPTETNPAVYYYDQGHYFLHIVKPRDEIQAFKSFMIAANFGSTRAKHQVAYCLQHGIGIKKDEKKAVEFYLENANSNPPNAASLCQLGICFQMGIGVEPDAPRAVKYYQQAVHKGNLDAMFNLAYCLRHGIGTPVDYQHAYSLYLRLAELGDPQGMKFAGNCYSAGIGTLKNDDEALKWFHRSSECDFYWGGKMEYALLLYEKAMCDIELGYTTFDPFTPNFVEAFHLIREVCDNFPSCPGLNKLTLGKFYHIGIGCQRDLQKALDCYRMALDSRFMTTHLKQECESLINDIYQTCDPSLSTVIKNELLIFDHSNGEF